jgi:hypothetical protein
VDGQRRSLPVQQVEEGLVLGRDALAPVSWDHPPGFPFTGTIERVRIELGDDVPGAVHEVFDR